MDVYINENTQLKLCHAKKMFLIAFFKFRDTSSFQYSDLNFCIDFKLLLVFQLSVFMTETSYSFNTAPLMSHNSQC
jgi:hypothetical protein